MAALATLVTLQAAQAQGAPVDAQAAEEPGRIGDGIKDLDRSTWLAFWGPFLIGIAALAVAIPSSWRYAHRLSRQIRQSADHFELIEDMKERGRACPGPGASSRAPQALAARHGNSPHQSS